MWLHLKKKTSNCLRVASAQWRSERHRLANHQESNQIGWKIFEVESLICKPLSDLPVLGNTKRYIQICRMENSHNTSSRFWDHCLQGKTFLVQTAVDQWGGSFSFDPGDLIFLWNLYFYLYFFDLKAMALLVFFVRGTLARAQAQQGLISFNFKHHC